MSRTPFTLTLSPNRSGEQWYNFSLNGYRPRLPLASPTPTVEPYVSQQNCDYRSGTNGPGLCLPPTRPGTGRLGEWRYEIGDMGHSVMMGVQAANYIVAVEKELVFHSS